MILLSGFVRNEATLSANIPEALQSAGSTEHKVTSAYGRMLAKLTATGVYPALRKVIAAGVFDQLGDPDDGFVFGLHRVLDAIDGLCESGAWTGKGDCQSRAGRFARTNRDVQEPTTCT